MSIIDKILLSFFEMSLQIQSITSSELCFNFLSRVNANFFFTISKEKIWYSETSEYRKPTGLKKFVRYKDVSAIGR